MKKKTLALVLAFTMTAALFTGCGSKKETETTQPQTETAAETESEEVDDQAAADEVAALIDAIYVQTRMRTQMSSVQQQKRHGTS